jgi:hypothetical protein
LQVANVKAWFSGRIASGSYGIYVRNGANLTFTAPYTQENSGHGFVAHGQARPLKGLSIVGGIFDGDNTSDSGDGGLALDNVVNGIVSCKVQAFTGAAGTPAFAVNFHGGTEGCVVDCTHDDVSGTAFVGDDLADNTVRG